MARAPHTFRNDAEGGARLAFSRARSTRDLVDSGRSASHVYAGGISARRVDARGYGNRSGARSRAMRRCAEAGVTLMELLIAVTLMSLLSVGIVISLRVALSAMNKTDTKLMSNRRVASVERILEQQIAGIMPVTAECQTTGEAPPARVTFFQGEAATMRLASSFSLQEGSRGMSVMLEDQVIPGEQAPRVRLVAHEHLYTRPPAAGLFCLGAVPDPLIIAMSARVAAVP